MSALELSLRGPVAERVAEQIRSRFGEIAIRTGAAPGTVLVVQGVDPAAQRALLILLWDTGHDVLAMHASGEPEQT
jgi:2-keto-3-deoxy-6-phosphogluconate aldolase